MLLDRAKSRLVAVFATDEEVDNKRLGELEERMHCPSISDAQDHKKVELVGRIHSATFFPGDPVHYAAELHDGTGRIVLVFLGRRRVPGLEPGRLVKVRGRVHAGATRKIFNPWYELLADDT